ncbi:MAG TPA: hypothetical protein VL307_09310, partial [Chitinophagaceae bacterium]|nr:hypothetical protein [Chitinophagaceae bacterium]
MPRELPEAKKSLPLNQEWATPPIPVEAAWASMQQILEREDRRLERRFLGKHAIFTLLTLCIAAVWLFFLPANNGTLINNPHQAMINPLLDTGRSPGPREAAQQEFYPTKSEFTEHLFYPLKKTYVKNKEEAEDREPASALHRAPAVDLHVRNKIMQVSAIQARFHKEINKRPGLSLSNKKTLFSKNKKFQRSADDLFNSNTEESIVEDQAGHHHSNLKELVSIQHRKKTSDKPLQGRPLQNDIIATTEIIVRTSN